MRKLIFLFVALFAFALLAFGLSGNLAAAPHNAFPQIIPLPDGFEPEGVVVGRGLRIYAGSLANGAIYEANLRTGEGDILVSPPADRTAVGLAFDRRTNFIYAAGGGLGTGYVYDAATGDGVAAYQLTDPGTFVNDAIVTRQAVYFTDSFRPFLYRLPLGPGGRVPHPNAVEEIELGGDFEQQPGFNANGIEATANGRYLLLVNSTLGTLYRVDPDTGEATLIDLNGGAVPSGDGLWLEGRTLYVVQNFLNQIAVVELAPDFLSGEIVDIITDPNFRIPTTVTSHGASLYAVNARFDTPAGPTVEYEIVRVPQH